MACPCYQLTSTLYTRFNEKNKSETPVTIASRPLKVTARDVILKYNNNCKPNLNSQHFQINIWNFCFSQVDLELNGEPLNIHMKLGESGEAFFVEEVPEDEVEASAHLATSPIPDSGFLYPPQQPAPLPRRNSADYPLDKYHNQVSDYSHRR